MDPGSKVKSDPRSAIPSVDRLIRRLADAAPGLPRWVARQAARMVVDAERSGTQPPASLEALVSRATALGGRLARPHPARVVNATGIVLHTNLGRAPLPAAGAAAVAGAAEGYSDLELDLESGRRGDRTAAVVRKLCWLSGAVGAHVVNNNAAALLLAVATLAQEREVIVSRGELVEIGGSFRIPDIVEAAGARLVEVGTTNRTHPGDVERAIGPGTALLLKVHRSNFEQRGFVSEVSLPQLAALGRARGVPVLEDLGSGTLIDLAAHGWPAEAHAPSRLRLGADLVCFSGDKLLGGPQAGILLGSDPAPIGAMRRNPLARALRIDKLSLAALDWVLDAHLDGTAERQLPVLRQLLAAPEELERRARALAARLDAALAGRARVAVRADRAFAGGGSLPGFELATWVVELHASCGPDRLAERLREGTPPVLARIREGALRLDVRSLLDGDEDRIEGALCEALR
jgi:L-seryl-tRNA(Ser) seleniumtransferase